MDKRKQDLKNRAMKLFNNIRIHSGLKMSFLYRGSLASNDKTVKVRPDGSYDLDIDIIGKFENISAPKLGDIIMKAVSKGSRSKEKVKNKTRSFFVGIDNGTAKYNLDIVVKKTKMNKPIKVLVYKQGKYSWTNM